MKEGRREGEKERKTDKPKEKTNELTLIEAKNLTLSVPALVFSTGACPSRYPTLSSGP